MLNLHDRKASAARSWRAGILLLSALLLASCGGSGSDTPAPETELGLPAGYSGPADGAPAAALPWPPAEAQRTASDDYYPFDGADFTLSGGAVAAAGTAADFSAGPATAWAIYSLGGFGPTVTLQNIQVEFAVTDGPVPGDTKLYFGLSSYAAGTWQWFTAAPDNLTLTPIPPGDYISPGGSSHLAVALAGPGSATVASVRFNRKGKDALPAAPLNLIGTSTWYSCSLDWDPVHGATGYNLYRSNSPTMVAATRVTTPPAADDNFIDESVSPSSTYYYAVKAIRQSESPYSNIVQLDTGESQLQPPGNLTGAPFVGRIELSWDEAPGSQGTYIYRSTQGDFAGAAKLQAQAVEGLTYNDTTITPGTSYYYWATTKLNSFESDPSNRAAVFAPQTNLPAPINLQVLSLKGDSVVVAWEWPGGEPNPAKFRVYFKRQADFPLTDESGLVYKFDVQGNKRQGLGINMPSDADVWFRVVPMDSSNNRGRTSDALGFHTESFYTIDGFETIGVGTGPLKAEVYNGDISVGYYDLVSVRHARRNAGAWSTESIGMDENGAPPARVFGSYLDMAAASDRLLIIAQNLPTGDLWGSEGPPGGPWTAAIINGTDSTAIGSPLSGMSCKVACSSTHFAVMHIEETAPGGTPIDKVFYHTRPISGGAWTDAVIRDDVKTSQAYHSLTELSGEFYALSCSVPLQDSLNFGSSADSFSWVDIDGGDANGLGAWNTLEQFHGHWYVAVSDTTAQGPLSLLDNSSGSWEMQTLDDTAGIATNCRMATDAERIYMVYLGHSPSQWYFAYYDGSVWKTQRLVIAGLIPTNHVDVVSFNGEPFFVFDSQGDNQLYAGQGIPPAP